MDIGIITCSLILAQSITQVSTLTAEEINFPDDPAVINIQEFGAKGDGKTDDTQAIQDAIRSTRSTKWTQAIYFPNGTYLITQPIKFDYHGDNPKRVMRNGPWLYGQSRDGVILKIPDGTPAFSDPEQPTALIHAHPGDDGSKTSADWFDRTMINFTLECGNNPGAVGLKFYSNNVGLLRHVTIRGNGIAGLDFGFIEENGPLLAENILIDGFATGLLTSHTINSQTVSNIDIRNWREFAVDNGGQVLTLENLSMTPLKPGAIRNDKRGVLTIVNQSLPADNQSHQLTPDHIQNEGIYFLRVSPAPGTSDAPPQEWTAGPVISSPPGTTGRSLNLPIRSTPDFAWDPDTANWVCANDYGAVPGDKDDDAPGIQAAIDAAAEQGKTTVYLRGLAKGDPNWYHIKSNVRVHGSVRHLLGIGFPRILGERFIIDDSSAPLVKFENLKIHSGRSSIRYENQSKRNTLIIESCNGVAVASAGGDLFLRNTTGGVRILHPESQAYARQLNPERPLESDRINCLNQGGLLWILGLKTEFDGTKIKTTNGGRTEVLGSHAYTNRKIEDDMPFFHTIDSHASFAGIREIFFHQKPYRIRACHEAEGEIWQHTTPRAWSLLQSGSE
jgi:hypothetical protein